MLNLLEGGFKIKNNKATRVQHTCLYRLGKLLQSFKRLKTFAHIIRELLTEAFFGELHAARHETGPVHGLIARCWRNNQC